MTPETMMATPPTPDEFHDWRSNAPCAAYDPEVFFDAAEADPRVEALAKNVCNGCPFQSRCLSAAMLANEEWGIWGGMNPQERLEYRPEWEKANGGRGAVRTMRQRNGVLWRRCDPYAERRFAARLQAAQRCYSLALAAGEFHRRDDYLAVLELIITHPTQDSGTIARWANMSKTRLNTMKREVFRMFNVEESSADEEMTA